MLSIPVWRGPIVASVLVMMIAVLAARAAEPAAKQTPRLVEWEGLKYGMFVHFGMSTFTGQEVDDGKSPSATYSPTHLDVRQWVQTAKRAGMKYMVLTAKHHSGHCLWDAANYDYDVATSRDKTDVVAEFMKACKEEDIKPGMYYAILDCHNGGVGVPGGPINDRYFQFVKRQLTELHTRYPGIYEQWIDIPILLSEPQRRELYALLKDLSPDCLVLMNQSLLLGWPTDLFYGERVYPSPPRYNPTREYDGKSYYIPMEVCDTIGQNWFWIPNDPPKDVKILYKMYSESVGRGANLLLDVPPDKTGRIPQESVDALMKLKTIIDDPSLLIK
jgi:alpha-L-fucosidase